MWQLSSWIKKCLIFKKGLIQMFAWTLGVIIQMTIICHLNDRLYLCSWWKISLFFPPNKKHWCMRGQIYTSLLFEQEKCELWECNAMFSLFANFTLSLFNYLLEWLNIAVQTQCLIQTVVSIWLPFEFQYGCLFVLLNLAQGNPFPVSELNPCVSVNSDMMNRTYSIMMS